MSVPRTRDGGGWVAASRHARGPTAVSRPCSLAWLVAVSCTPAAAQEYTPDTPPDRVPDPDGPVTADELARGAIDVTGTPVHDNAFRIFGIADRLEYATRGGDPGYVWDTFGYAGGDYNRLWIQSEGESSFDGGLESADLQLLYSRAITSYWNAQVGWRRTFEGDDTNYLVIAAEGLNYFWTGVEADLYISEDGDASSSFTLEYDEPITQRLMLQPRLEANLQFQDVERKDLGAGITDYQVGLRLRYEIVREFAPYVGVSWAQTVFGTADRLPEGEDAGTFSAVAGVRAWF